MATREEIDETLNELFDAERAVRELHDELADSDAALLEDALVDALEQAKAETDEEEGSLRLVRIAALLAETETPQSLDALVDILASEHPEARQAAAKHLKELAFDRFPEVALAIERALERLPVESPALPELPYLVSEVPDAGVVKLLGEFVDHADPDAVAAAIEVMVELGDPGARRHLQRIASDTRTVSLVDDEGEATSEVSLGELALEALHLLEPFGEAEEEPPPNTPRRGGAS